MSREVIMPTMGLTMESGLIVKWLKAEGEAVKKGEALLVIETDKSTADVEAEADGVLLKRYYSEGETVACKKVIAYLGEAGESAPATPPDAGAAGAPQAAGAAIVQAAPVSTPVFSAPKTGGRVFISPRAKKVAAENGFDYATLTGSGPGGRIVEADVRAALGGRAPISPLARKVAMLEGVSLEGIAGTGPAGRIMKEDILSALAKLRAVSRFAPAASAVEIPLSPKRKTIARRLSESMHNSPHFYLTLSIDMSELLAARARYNEKVREKQKKISLNAIIVKMVSVALAKNPYLNASWQEDKIVLFRDVDVGVAVAVEDGLITPVLRATQNKGVMELDAELSELIERARDNRLKPDEYTQASFTISNLGMYDIESFSAIINPPGAAILAVGKVMERAVVVNGDIVARPMMSVTISCDHRVVDGAVGAAFMHDLKEIMESPVLGFF